MAIADDSNPAAMFFKGETGRNTRGLLRLIILLTIAAAAVSSRLFSVIRFESIIHECMYSLPFGEAEVSRKDAMAWVANATAPNVLVSDDRVGSEMGSGSWSGLGLWVGKVAMICFGLMARCCGGEQTGARSIKVAKQHREQASSIFEPSSEKRAACPA